MSEVSRAADKFWRKQSEHNRTNLVMACALDKMRRMERVEQMISNMRYYIDD